VIDKGPERESPAAKRLLDNWGTVWLFEIRQDQRVSYLVQTDEQSWTFGLLFAARGKLERLAAKPEEHQGRRT